MKITIEATPLEVSEVICALVNYGANTVGDTDGDTDDDDKVIIVHGDRDIVNDRLLKVIAGMINRTTS